MRKVEKHEKVKIFEKELNYILNPTIKTFTKKAIEKIPDYFFTVPSSSTGKYHAAYALGGGGLARHVRACVRIAVELYRMEMFNWMNDDDKDLVIASLILHDSYKQGKDGSGGHTLTEHPILAKFAIIEDPELNSILTQKQLEKVGNNIARHMGAWTKDFMTEQEVLEKPKTKMENFVHLVDYIASRKCLEMNFDVEIKR